MYVCFCEINCVWKNVSRHAVKKENKTCWHVKIVMSMSCSVQTPKRIEEIGQVCT